MRLTPKDKGKSVMTRSIDEIVFSTDMAALDFEPNREEETFLQIIGLDRFITRVTWEILNEQVVREVIANLNTETMETKLNGQIIPIFSKTWRQKMKAVFYLNTFIAKREPGTPRVHAADIFPNIKEKMRNKLGTCKINDCTIPEARKPLKFFNSLFLLRTSPTTISCTAVAHIQDALNGKEVDWPALFLEHIKLELIALKEGLFKDRNTSMRTLVGPPLTMLLINEGFLTVQQEISAGILMPAELTEKPASKKRKLETEMELIRGEPSDQKEVPNLLVAMAKPISAQSAITESCAAQPIPAPAAETTPGAALHKTELTKILERFTQTTQMLSNWVTQTKESKETIVTDKDTTGISQTLLQNQKTALETQLQQIQEQFKAATSKIEGLNIAAETRKKALQEKWNSYRERVTKAAQEINHLRTTCLGVKQTALDQIQVFSKGIEELKTEFKTIKDSELSESDRAMALTKIEAFDHWIDGQSETKEQMTAKLLLERVTAKMSHTFHNLKAALNQVTTERDEL